MGLFDIFRKNEPKAPQKPERDPRLDYDDPDEWNFWSLYVESLDYKDQGKLFSALQAREELTREWEREPTPAEIAQKLGEEKESIARALEAIVEPISLYEPVYSENGDSIYVMDQLSDTSAEDEHWAQSVALRDAMNRLSERERKIIEMRFYGNKTQMEIAESIGISQAQVSRLEKGALARMRNQI